MVTSSLVSLMLDQVVVTQLACGQRHSAVLSQDGVLFTFGAGRAGQLGHGNLKDQSRPRRLSFFDGGCRAGANWQARVVEDRL